MNIRKQYWKYSLITIILLFGVIIFLHIRPFLSGILGAITIYLLLRSQMIYLTEKKELRRGCMAFLLLCETILFFLIPMGLFIWLIVSKLQDLDLDTRTLLEPVEHVAELIHRHTGYNLLDNNNISSIVYSLPKIGQIIVGSMSSLVINVIVLIFVLYFMLIGGKKMETYLNEILPFNKKNTEEVLSEINMIVKSNAIGIPLLAAIQGAIAMLGYYLFGAPAPFLFGILSCFATIIPIIGTAIIWLPLALYIGATGDWPNAIGLSVYALLVISNVDNLIRFLLQKKIADTHPLITIFGVVIGLSLFGFMGVIFGPLLLSLFILCINIFKKEYLEGK